MPDRNQIVSPQASSERGFRSTVLEVAPANIAFFKAVIESYDNLATLRTEDPARHHLKLWFDSALEGDVNELIAALSRRLSIRVVRTN